GGQPLICSKRRSKALQKTVNQIAKTQKLLAKHINQRFFDPSTSKQKQTPSRKGRGLSLKAYCLKSQPVMARSSTVSPAVT
ncbi:hypothetical protein OQ252_12915, partial [Acetobacter farinalis]